MSGKSLSQLFPALDFGERELELQIEKELQEFCKQYPEFKVDEQGDARVHASGSNIRVRYSIEDNKIVWEATLTSAVPYTVVSSNKQKTARGALLVLARMGYPR